MLKQHFFGGQYDYKYPHIVKQIIQDGHHIANHTWAHYRLDEMSKDQIECSAGRDH